MADEGATGVKQIAPLEVGNKTRTARHSAVMNEIIAAINSIRSLKVTPPGGGKFLFSDANSILQLAGTASIPDPPTEDTWVLGSIDGVVQWIETSDCADSGLNMD